ncbi:putative Pentatricopeptide repeat-containing protein [Cocos nucifera]|uniref:Putative Pentatricopeptide repeat-containing protein n=1 Tax=Cocos nucifera TaxID=13894 RepID=A0A8K0NDP8_COCNU|nr:putative Pentatricopeptide repeat-containing protein [Cocos nucifera]
MKKGLEQGQHCSSAIIHSRFLEYSMRADKSNISLGYHGNSGLFHWVQLGTLEKEMGPFIGTMNQVEEEKREMGFLSFSHSFLSFFLPFIFGNTEEEGLFLLFLRRGGRGGSGSVRCSGTGGEEVEGLLLPFPRKRKTRRFIEWLEANKRIEPVERDYASHLDLVAKVHGLQKAEKYIEKIPESFRGEVIYRTLLANCVAAVNVTKAEEVFNKIRDLGFPITTFACNQLLLLYKRVDRKKIADVLLMMEKENVKPSLFTYRLLIDTKGRANDISGMEQIIETMKGEGVEPDLLIQAMVAKHYIFGGLNEKAEAALKEMEGDDIKVNRAACKALLPLYAALGKADDVGRVWKACEAHPRLEECLAAIEAWGKLGQIENAEAVFENMLKMWKKLSSKYYNALLKVYANHKLLSKGKELVKRMSDNSCKIGPLTWDALVKLYVEAGEVEKADSILQKAAQQNQIKPLYSSYIAVLDQYSKRGDIPNAEKIFHRLRQIGYVGRMRQYQSLLQAYINAKTPAYGFRERMKADNMFPNKAVAAQLAAVDAFKKTQISDLLD